jgi:hypothetical protein
MNINILTAIVSILIVLSVASEKLVEIIKGFKRFAWLNEPPSGDPKIEARRKMRVSVVAVIAGIVTAFLASPLLAVIFKDLFKDNACPPFQNFFNGLGDILPCGMNLSVNGLILTLALGFLASGGSALWNSVLEYLLKLKDLTKMQIRKTAAETLVEEAKAASIRAETARIETLTARENRTTDNL